MFDWMNQRNRLDNKLRIGNVSNSCDICHNDENRTAVTVNEVKVCHECLEFIKTQAKLNGNSKMKELDLQTKYIASNCC